jgi:hypothetical protein
LSGVKREGCAARVGHAEGIEQQAVGHIHHRADMGREGNPLGEAGDRAVEGGEVFGHALEAQHRPPDHTGEIDMVARLRAASGRNGGVDRPPDRGEAEAARALGRNRIPAQQRCAVGGQGLVQPFEKARIIAAQRVAEQHANRFGTLGGKV